MAADSAGGFVAAAPLLQLVWTCNQSAGNYFSRPMQNRQRWFPASARTAASEWRAIS